MHRCEERVLLKHKIKRLPVLDQSGQLVGLVSLVGRGGILQALARDSFSD